MKEKKILITLVIITFLLSLVLFVNIGYADESLISTPSSINTPNFDITFNQFSDITSKEIIITGPKTATLKDISLSSLYEKKTLIIPISNNSTNLSAKLYSEISNSNPEYFNVTSSLSNSIIKPNSKDVILELTIELIKIPTTKSETTKINLEIISEPIY